MGIVVSTQKRLSQLAARAALNATDSNDMAEYAADMDYRLCLMELGITEDDLSEGATEGATSSEALRRSVAATAQSAGAADTEGGETE